MECFLNVKEPFERHERSNKIVYAWRQSKKVSDERVCLSIFSTPRALTQKRDQAPRYARRDGLCIQDNSVHLVNIHATPPTQQFRRYQGSFNLFCHSFLSRFQSLDEFLGAILHSVSALEVNVLIKNCQFRHFFPLSENFLTKKRNRSMSSKVSLARAGFAE